MSRNPHYEPDLGSPEAIQRAKNEHEKSKLRKELLGAGQRKRGKRDRDDRLGKRMYPKTEQVNAALRLDGYRRAQAWIDAKVERYTDQIRNALPQQLTAPVNVVQILPGIIASARERQAMAGYGALVARRSANDDPMSFARAINTVNQSGTHRGIYGY